MGISDRSVTRGDDPVSGLERPAGLDHEKAAELAFVREVEDIGRSRFGLDARYLL
jgi:hypothetical protein